MHYTREWTLGTIHRFYENGLLEVDLSNNTDSLEEYLWLDLPLPKILLRQNNSQQEEYKQVLLGEEIVVAIVKFVSLNLHNPKINRSVTVDVLVSDNEQEIAMTKHFFKYKP
jgi:hypothetical protein